MKLRMTHHLLAALIGVALTADIHAQDPEFTYQGRLDDNGTPANGSFDFRFTIYNGSETNATAALSVTDVDNVATSNGLFTARIAAPAWVLNGERRWLAVEVRTNATGELTALSPWTEITPTPYAVRALTVSSNALMGEFGGAVSFSNPSNTFTGTFVGDGTGLTNTTATSLGGLSADDFWQLGGNFGTVPGVNFLGTTDDQPLELKVNNQRGLRLELNGGGSAGAPNVIGGSQANVVGAGVVGATIAGGGATNYGTILSSNAVHANYATIGGGLHNYIATGSEAATIDGGIFNEIGVDANWSVVGGGWNNDIAYNAKYATIPGGTLNDIGAGAFYAFAAGRRAKANHQGAFVWADSQNADFTSTADNQFLIRASGGVGIGTTSPVGALDVNGTATATSFSGSGSGLTALNASQMTSGTLSDSRLSVNVAKLDVSQTFTGPLGIRLNAADRPMITRGWDPFTSGPYVGAGRWGLFMETSHLTIGMPAVGGRYVDVAKYNADGTSTVLLTVDQSGNLFTTGAVNPPSDRHVKHDFESVNAQAVLEQVAKLPLHTWSYTNDSSGFRHLGPVAQDFHTAFGLGTDERHIATVDADGVALAAIQGLNQKLEETRAENAQLRQELQELKDLIATITKKGNL